MRPVKKSRWNVCLRAYPQLECMHETISVECDRLWLAEPGHAAIAEDGEREERGKRHTCSSRRCTGSALFFKNRLLAQVLAYTSCQRSTTSNHVTWLIHMCEMTDSYINDINWSYLVNTSRLGHCTWTSRLVWNYTSSAERPRCRCLPTRTPCCKFGALFEDARHWYEWTRLVDQCPLKRRRCYKNVVSFDFNVSYSSCWGYSLRQIECLLWQPPIGENDDYDNENSWISGWLPSCSRKVKP